MLTHKPKSIASAFSGRLLRTCIVSAGLTVALFAWLHQRQCHELARQAAIEQARLIAATIVPGPDGDLTNSVERLRMKYDRLLAVATIDSSGIANVYPDRPAHRLAYEHVQSALPQLAWNSPHPAAWLDIPLPKPESGDDALAACVIVPLNGEEHLTSLWAILLATDAPTGPWLESAFLFAAPVAATGLFGFLSLTGWFHRRVAGPLQDLGEVIGNPRLAAERNRPLKPGGWRETTQIAIQFEELLKTVALTDAYRRRTEATSRRELAKREQGFQQQLRRAEDRVFTDPLTKLRNRAYLEEHLERIFEEQRHDGGDLSAVALDIDNFKQHNDTFGHQAGDALLKFIGTLLNGSLRPSDHAIRYGGDEFILLLPSANTAQAALVANRVVKLFGQYARRLGPATNVSLSAGVASLRDDRCNCGDDLVNRADSALYAAKRVGKNTVAAGHSS